MFRELYPALTVTLDGQPDAVGMFDHHLLRRKQAVEGAGDVGARQPVGPFQNPDQIQ
jgi:hypothetical protein